jgi:guanine nucleotide-binding protein G(i) subunit alpha
LFLGAGESGKSTVVKQMKIIHSGGFKSQEIAEYRRDVFRNVSEGMQQILHSMTLIPVRFHRNIAKRSERHAQYILNNDLDWSAMDQLPPEFVVAIKFLWLESGLKLTFDKFMHFSYVIDSAAYFCDEIDRIGQAGYVPNATDILKARSKTTGITEYDFFSGPHHFKMLDVAGQRSERKKWIHSFENVTTLIFCVALSEYDQFLVEDESQNRLMESFRLFEDIVNSRWFFHTSIVLFLNKKDVFRKKLKYNPLSRYLADYTGGDNFEAASLFIRDKFLQLNQNHLKIYPYLTCATDTENINMVFAAVKETILANALRESGMF